MTKRIVIGDLSLYRGTDALNFDGVNSTFTVSVPNTSRIEIKDINDYGTSKLEADRWLMRVSHHIARITFHMEKAILYTAK